MSLPGGVYVAIADEVGISTTVLILVVIAGAFLWGYLKDKGYLLYVSAGVLVFIIAALALYGSLTISALLFYGALLAWVLWKIESNNTLPSQERAELNDTVSAAPSPQERVAVYDKHTRLPINIEETVEKITSARLQGKSLHLSIRNGAPALLLSTSRKLCQNIESLVAIGIPEEEAIREALTSFTIE